MFLFVFFLFFSCTDNLKIESQDVLFLVYGGNKRNETQLASKVSNKEQINFILEGIQNLNRINDPFMHHPTLWSIDILDANENIIFGAYSMKNGKLNCFLSQKFNFYKNDELFEYLKELALVEKIRSYKEVVSQEKYNEMLRK